VKATTRYILTAASAIYVGTLIVLVGRVPLSVLNDLLAVAVVPLVWLIWAFARWSVYQDASRHARDIEKVHGQQAVTEGRVRR
jgi:type VI protein secretion system component VasK